MTTDIRAALLDLIATYSFKLGDFTLASGLKSDYYIDCRTTTLHAEGGRLAGLAMYELMREHMPSAVAVGGLTMGADPLVSNVASASAWALAEYNEVRAEAFGPTPPASASVAVAGLIQPDAIIEIEAVAFVPDPE